jgi:hypothetical protein
LAPEACGEELDLRFRDRDLARGVGGKDVAGDGVYEKQGRAEDQEMKQRFA